MSKETERSLVQTLFEDRELQPQKAIHALCDYLLGEDYTIVDPVCNIQANAIIVDEILLKYSKRYRKERAIYQFNRSGGKEIRIFGHVINIKKGEKA